MEFVLTQNTAQCLRDVHHVGGYNVYNVCTGSVNWVPWGLWDWLGVSVSAGLVAAIIAAIWIYLSN